MSVAPGSWFVNRDLLRRRNPPDPSGLTMVWSMSTWTGGSLVVVTNPPRPPPAYLTATIGTNCTSLISAPRNYTAQRGRRRRWPAPLHIGAVDERSHRVGHFQQTWGALR